MVYNLIKNEFWPLKKAVINMIINWYLLYYVTDIWNIIPISNYPLRIEHMYHHQSLLDHQLTVINEIFIVILQLFKKKCFSCYRLKNKLYRWKHKQLEKHKLHSLGQIQRPTYLTIICILLPPIFISILNDNWS